MKRFCLLLVSLLTFGGCLAVPPQPYDGHPLERLVSLGGDGLFAADPGARQVAVAGRTLQLIDLETQEQLSLPASQPVALAWHPDGSLLAVAVPEREESTRLLQFSARGELRHQVVLPIVVSQMKWSARGDLLVAGYRLKVYSFGGNLSQALFRVDGDVTSRIDLSDITLKPTTVRQWQPRLAALLPVAFSPPGDELVFISPHDPPEFAPYMEYQFLHWEAGTTKKLAKLPVLETRLDWQPHGESVTVTTPHDRIPIVIWPPDEVAPGPDRGSRTLVAGEIYRGGEVWASWDREGTRVQVFEGGRYLLGTSDALYRGGGLPVAPAESYSEKIWTLRRWRAQGLITPADYRAALREVR